MSRRPGHPNRLTDLTVDLQRPWVKADDRHAAGRQLDDGNAFCPIESRNQASGYNLTEESE